VAFGQKPTEEGRYEVELLTMGPGDDLVSMLGHSALRVIDRQESSDRVFNWGTLNYRPTLALEAARGPLVYYLSVESFDACLVQYASEGRAMVGQRLDLSAEASEALVRAVEHNALPENRDYAYNHFRNNCATRPRDVLDRFSGGALRAESDRPAHRTARQIIYEDGAPLALATVGFDLITNGTWDRQVTFWEACYLPRTLREVTARAVLGEESRPLVYQERVYIERHGIDPTVRGSHFETWALFLLPLVLLVLTLAFSVRGVKGDGVPPRGLALLSLWSFALVAGGAGMTCALAWALTEHSDLAWNATLLVVLPLDLAAPWLVSKACSRSTRFQSAAIWYLALRIVVAVASVVLSVIGTIQKDMLPIGVPMILCLVFVLVLSRRLWSSSPAPRP